MQTSPPNHICPEKGPSRGHAGDPTRQRQGVKGACPANHPSETIPEQPRTASSPPPPTTMNRAWAQSLSHYRMLPRVSPGRVEGNQLGRAERGHHVHNVDEHFGKSPSVPSLLKKNGSIDQALRFTRTRTPGSPAARNLSRAAAGDLARAASSSKHSPSGPLYPSPCGTTREEFLVLFLFLATLNLT